MLPQSYHEYHQNAGVRAGRRHRLTLPPTMFGSALLAVNFEGNEKGADVKCTAGLCVVLLVT